MPSPLGEGQTVPPKNRHHQGEVEVPCGRFAGQPVRIVCTSGDLIAITPVYWSHAEISSDGCNLFILTSSRTQNLCQSIENDLQLIKD